MSSDIPPIDILLYIALSEEFFSLPRSCVGVYTVNGLYKAEIKTVKIAAVITDNTPCQDRLRQGVLSAATSMVQQVCDL